MRTTLTVTKAEEVKEEWYLIDVAGQRIGRVATKIAEVLLGKNDPKLAISANLLPKHKVIVINADQLDISPSKRAQKLYTNYSGFQDGLRTRTLDAVMKHDSTEVIEHAVKGMLPRNRKGNAIMGANLYVYKGAEYKQTPNNPKTIKLS